ncbi:hypothetical protein Dsin_030139 [Dipteronia sinensis]|uniref:Glycosyl hydrolase family 38 C-terminal domain-containing protein n=1 Tax=Dipteronia sinensis TaxID=43782 RepID=A0AAE0DQS0_9ROSI|nr:hypothetical protein Dsin_030139 [Dipteronia sinensis]
MINKIRDYRTNWNLEVNQPVARNYYPINLGIYTQDSKKEFSVLVDRPFGGSSIVDGHIELMLYRAVAEALNETDCVAKYCKGLTVHALYPLWISCMIGKMIEMSLSANQERTEMEKKRLVWKVEGSSSEEESKLVRGGPVDPTKLVVQLAPMEIRTFVIDFHHESRRRVFIAQLL